MVPKVIRHFFLVIITLLFCSCAQVLVTPAIVSNTPTAGGQEHISTYEIQATLTPTGESTPTPQEQVTIYANYGFRFTLPPGYQTVNQRIEGDLHLWLGIAKESDGTKGYNLTPIGLRVFEKSVVVNLIDWFAEKQGDCYEYGEQPPSGVYFIDPRVENEETFKGSSAIKYESGCWPVPYEIVIDRGKWVIALYYLRDYPIDYEADYNRILASLEFFQPEPGTVEIATPAPPTSTPIACLDEAAQPIELPSRQIPLEVRFISDGNLWVWNQGGLPAQQISDTGDAQSFYFAPDGEVIAFTRGKPYSQTELWAIDRDGSNLRLLISADQLHILVGEPMTTEFTYKDNISYIGWIDDTHELGFEILRSYDAIGGCCESGGNWQVDLDSGKLAAWTPPPDFLTAQEGLVSPDGSQIALVGETGLTLVNIDGSNRRENVLTYPYILQEEGGGYIHPYVAWAPDSESLAAITYSENIWAGDETFTTWRVPVDGLPAQELATFTGFQFLVYLSPNQMYLAYSRVTRLMSNDRELHIAFFDGSKDLVYAQGHLMGFWGWAPDSFHFIFGQFSTLAPLWGSVCGGSQSLLNPPVLPARQFTWVDSEHFLLVKGGLDNSRAELRLGLVGGGSILIGPFNGEFAQFQFDPDEEALGGLK